MLFLARYWKIEERWPSLSCAGLFAGLSLAVRPPNALFVLAVFLWLSVKRPSWRALWLFSLFPVLVGLSVAAYNWFVFGNLAGLYADWTGGRFWPGFLGLLISPSRGLLVYTPVVLFSLAGVAIWLKPKQFMDPPAYFAAAFLALSQLLITSKWTGWWGGDCFGPRLLTDVVPGLILLMIPALEGWGRLQAMRWALGLVLAFSIGVQFVGVFCYPNSNWDLTPVPSSVRPERFWDWADNPIVRSIKAGPRIGPDRPAFGRALETPRK